MLTFALEIALGIILAGVLLAALVVALVIFIEILPEILIVGLFALLVLRYGLLGLAIVIVLCGLIVYSEARRLAAEDAAKGKDTQ